MNPRYMEARVAAPRLHAELVESLLQSQGAVAVTITDMNDVPWWEPGIEPELPEKEVFVTGLFPLDSDKESIGSTLSLLPFLGTPEYREVEEREWERAWLDRFQPMKFGERLWIIPTGMEPPDPGGDLVHLDPGLAFGTGTHPTTGLCLEWLDGQDLRGLRVIDFGCGSGILGIAAAVKGAGQVIGIDNDPQAVQATGQNAERNGVAERVEVHEAGHTGTNQGDVVLANILAVTLIRLAADIAGSVRTGGQLALSGILHEQASSVSEAFQPWFPELSVTRQDEWVLLSGIRQQ